MADSVRYFELNTGAKIPSLGLGTWQSEPSAVGNAVSAAIKIGYRHIDCAQVYGNEAEIGSVLKKLFDDGVVKREELFITSKLWNTDHAPEDVPKALEKTLRDLQLDYVDLYLIHWPVRMKKGSVGLKPEHLIPTDIPSTWKAVAAAIKLGYRHIDCAQAYCNEAEIGSVLKQLFDDGVVKREELFITSKLRNSDHTPEDVPMALERTLQDLQLDYVDLYLIHWPVRMKQGSVGYGHENLVPSDIPSTWKAMEALYDSGKAKAIGVSNFSTKKLGDLLQYARIPPAANQVECHPSWHQTKLREFCKSKGIHLSGYSPLGSPGTTWLKSEVLKDPILNTVAEKLGKTPAQVALRWGIQMGHSVLPKSTHENRIKENFDVFDWCIPDDLFAKFSEIQQARLVRGSAFVHETLGEYKTVEDLWDGEI